MLPNAITVSTAGSPGARGTYPARTKAKPPGEFRSFYNAFRHILQVHPHVLGGLLLLLWPRSVGAFVRPARRLWTPLPSSPILGNIANSTAFSPRLVGWRIRCSSHPTSFEGFTNVSYDFHSVPRMLPKGDPAGEFRVFSHAFRNISRFARLRRSRYRTVPDDPSRATGDKASWRVSKVFPMLLQRFASGPPPTFPLPLCSGRSPTCDRRQPPAAADPPPPRPPAAVDPATATATGRLRILLFTKGFRG